MRIADRIGGTGRGRWLRWLVVVLVGVELCWVVVANLALLGPLSGVLSRRPEKLVVSWERAWSWYPGQVGARGLVIRSQTARMQTEISAETAAGRIGLIRLLGRRFVVHGLSGDGVVVRARHRVDAAPEFGKLEKSMPPVAGLENPPEVKPEELYGARKHSWTISFEDARWVEGEEIWIDAVRVGAGVSVSGSAEIVTRKHFELKRIEVRLDGVAARVAEASFAEGLQGVISLRLGPIPMPGSVPSGERIELPLADADLGVDLRGRLDAQPVFSLLFGRFSWWSLDAGLGTLEARAQVEDGALVPGSRVAFDLDALALDVAELRFAGHGQMSWSVPEDGGGWGFDLHSARFDVGAAGEDLDLLSADRVELTARGPHLELERLRDGVTFSGELDGGVCENIASWNELLPAASGFELTSGRGLISARFEAEGDSQRGSASAELEVKQAELSYLGRAMRGTVRLAAKMPVLELDHRRYTLDGTRLELVDFQLEPPWSGEVVLDRGSLAPKQEPYLDVHATVHMTDARPALSLLLAKRGLPQWFGNLLDVNPVDGDASLALGANQIRGGPFDLAGEHAGVEGLFTLRDGALDGIFYLGYRKLGVGLESVRGEKDLHLRGARQWFDEALAARMPG